jgi:hypothetical protein
MKEPGRSSETWPVRAMRHVKAWWFAGLVVVVFAGYVGLAGLAWWAQWRAHDVADRAAREFPGDRVEALIGLVQSETHTLAERTQAVNALGQMGSHRALPVLSGYYTGRECEHSRFLCQYELRKALDRCRGRNWAPSWLPFFPRPPLQGGA